MPVAMVIAWAIQKPFGMAISLAQAVAVEAFAISLVGTDAMIMVPSELPDEREDAGADASESARRSRHC